MSRKSKTGRKPKIQGTAEPAPVTPIERRLRRFRILSWLCLSGGMMALFYYGGEWLAERRVLNEGIARPATIFGMNKTTKAGGESTYKLTISYDRDDPPAGEEANVHQDFTMDSATYEAIRAAEPLTIRYLPDRPETARVVGMPSEQPIKIAVAAVVSLIGSALAWLAFRRR